MDKYHKPWLTGLAMNMTGKGKNKNIIPGKKMKESAISTLACGHNKIPNSICKPNPSLMDSTTIDTSGVI